jgi:hypothetical protein
MKFTLYQRIKPLKFEYFCFFIPPVGGFPGNNFEKPNCLKNNGFLRTELDRSHHSNVKFSPNLIGFWYWKAFLGDSQVIFF